MDDLKKIHRLTYKISLTLQYLSCHYPQGISLHLVKNNRLGCSGYNQHRHFQRSEVYDFYYF